MKTNEKTYEFDITLEFTQRVHATNEEDAVKQLKESFQQDYSLELEEHEYTLIK